MPQYKTDDKNLQKAMWILNHSKTGRSLLSKAVKSGYQIICEDLTAKNIGAGCHPRKKIILLPDNNKPEVLAFKLSHELAHAEQIMKGTVFSYVANDTKTSIMTSRCMEADAVTKHSIIACELKDKGYNEPYEEAKAISPESLYAVEKSIKDKSNPYVAGFKAWFTSSFLVNFYDKQHAALLSRLSEEIIAQPDAFKRKRSSKSLVKSICRDNNGKCYLQDSLDIMERPLYVGISSRHAQILNAFFANREEEHGIKCDQHIENIAVFENHDRENPPAKEKNKLISKLKTRRDYR